MTKTANSGGNQISYQVFGSGQPLVFLHGFLESSNMWTDCAELFSKSHKVVLVDLPGHGKSSLTTDLESMNGMARAVKEVCLAEKCDCPIVLGHSMGGYVALELLKLMNCKVALIHSNFWSDSEIKQLQRNRVIEIVEDNLKSFVKTAIPNLFAPESKEICRPDIESLIIQAAQMNPKAVIAATAGMRDRLDNTSLMKAHKVGILQGEKDSIITKQQMDIALSSIESEPFYVVLKKCGHMGFLEQPKAFLQALHEIIIKLSGISTKN